MGSRSCSSGLKTRQIYFYYLGDITGKSRPTATKNSEGNIDVDEKRTACGQELLGMEM